jgi:hypothetical protein
MLSVAASIAAHLSLVVLAALAAIGLAIVLAIVLAIGAAVMLPVRLRVRLDSEARPRLVIGVRAVAGLIRFKLPRSYRTGDEGIAEPDPGTPVEHQSSNNRIANRKERRRKRRRQGDSASWLRLLLDRDLRHRIRRFVDRELGAVHVSLSEADIVFGLDDPADTGTLFAAYIAARGLIEDRLGGTVTASPDFSNPRLAIRARGEIAFTPIRLVIPVAALGIFVWRARRRQKTGSQTRSADGVNSAAANSAMANSVVNPAR